MRIKIAVLLLLSSAVAASAAGFGGFISGGYLLNPGFLLQSPGSFLLDGSGNKLVAG